MIAITPDPATIERALRRLLADTRKHQTDDLLYGRVAPRLRAGATALHWLESQGRAMATEPEFAECPTFRGKEGLASDTLALLCAIRAVTWHPGDADDFGQPYYYINIG